MGILLIRVDTESNPYTVSIYLRACKTKDSTAVTCDMYTSVEDYVLPVQLGASFCMCACGWELVVDVGGGRQDLLWRWQWPQRYHSEVSLGDPELSFYVGPKHFHSVVLIDFLG